MSCGRRSSTVDLSRRQSSPDFQVTAHPPAPRYTRVRREGTVLRLSCPALALWLLPALIISHLLRLVGAGSKRALPPPARHVPNLVEPLRGELVAAHIQKPQIFGKPHQVTRPIHV